jgi:hypothetical protein
MPKLITGIPADKMQSFARPVSPSGFDEVSVVSRRLRKRNGNFQPSIPHLKRIASSFILFDWEFFSNELEYE